MLVTIQYCGHQTRLEVIQLETGIAQASDLDHCCDTQVQSCASGQPKQINAARGDVLAHLPGRNDEASGLEFVMKLGVNQVHLAQIGLARIASYPRAMLDRLT